ncbi:MAG: hypothetical protein RH917_03740 [Lacipirellulaceae bacterium]
MLSFAFVVIVAVGCGDSVPTLADVNNTNIKKLRGAYGLYLVNHGMKGPENEEEFKQYLKTDEGAKVKMGRMGVTPEMVDSIFISDRDGKPFKIRYGLKGLGDHAIIFEEVGVEGKRQISFIEPREVGAEEYEQLWNGARPKNTVDGNAEMTKAFDG